jgi:hypothetical protein
MSQITAVAKLHQKTNPSQGAVNLGFSADYADERNKAWAKYTPSLGITMSVTEEVAVQFEQGKNYLITFEAQ